MADRIIRDNEENVLAEPEARAFWPALPGIEDCDILFASRAKYSGDPSYLLAVVDGEPRFAYGYLADSDDHPEGGRMSVSEWDAYGFRSVRVYLPTALHTHLYAWSS